MSNLITLRFVPQDGPATLGDLRQLIAEAVRLPDTHEVFADTRWDTLQACNALVSIELRPVINAPMLEEPTA